MPSLRLRVPVAERCRWFRQLRRCRAHRADLPPMPNICLSAGRGLAYERMRSPKRDRLLPYVEDRGMMVRAMCPVLLHYIISHLACCGRTVGPAILQHRTRRRRAYRGHLFAGQTRYTNDGKMVYHRFRAYFFLVWRVCVQSRGLSENHAINVLTQAMMMTSRSTGSHFGHRATSIEASHASNNTPCFLVVEKSSESK